MARRLQRGHLCRGGAVTKRFDSLAGYRPLARDAEDHGGRGAGPRGFRGFNWHDTHEPGAGPLGCALLSLKAA